MIKQIVTVDHPDGLEMLSRVCDPVPHDPTITGPLFRDLLDTANWATRHHRMGCLGLSANQICLPYTAFVLRWGNIFIPVMNPEIVETSFKTTPSKEGCLSRPKLPPAIVKRWKWVVLQWTDPYTLETKKQKFKKVDARVVQHEMDHGNGVLI